MMNYVAVSYSFVKHYYQSLHEKPTELYALYTEDAKLTHSKIPEGNEISFISKSIENHSSSKKAEIKSYYSSATFFADSKIRVTSIDCQEFHNDAILIAVVGELALSEESPVYRFSQSFILVPGKAPNSYDIANDIFRLIPDEDFELNNEEDETSVKTETVPISVEDVVAPEDTEAAAPAVPAVPNGKAAATEAPKEATPAASVVKEESSKAAPVVKEEQKETSSTEDVKPETDGKVEETKPEEIKKVEDKKEEVSKPAAEQAPKPSPKPTGPMSWAQVSQTAKAAAHAKNAADKASASASASASKPAAKASSSSASTPPAGQSKEASSNSSPAHGQTPLNNITNQKAQQQQQQQQSSSNNNSNYKKRQEHLFPVKVDNINKLNGPQLKKGLEEAFGRTNKVEPRGFYALVDFETGESQAKALKKKELRIENSVVAISRKSDDLHFNDKKKSNYNNNNNANNNNVNGNKKQNQNGYSAQKKKVKQNSQ